MASAENIPEDGYRLVYIIFYLMGVGNLMPWNFFINVQEYWDHKFRNVSDHTDTMLQNTLMISLTDENSTGVMVSDTDEIAKTPLQLAWNSYLSISNMIPNLGMLLLNATMGHKMPMRPRLLGSLIGIIILFIVTDIMTQVNTDSFQTGFLGLTLVTVVLITSCVGILQGGLAGLAGQFPAKYMGSLIQGQAVGGIITAIINILSIKFSTDPSHSAFYCFLVAAIFIALDTVAFLAMNKSPFYKYYTEKDETSNKSSSSKAEEEEALVESQNNGRSTLKGDAGNITTDTVTNDVGHSSNVENTLLITSDDKESEQTSTFAIISKIWVWIATIFITFVVCLSVFPSVTAIVESTEKGKGHVWNDVYFTPVGCFLLFNIGDYIGRILASIFKWPKATKSGSMLLLTFSIMRLAFIPLFLFCNASPMNRNITKVYIESDSAFLVLIALLSISNGYIGNIVMMFGPKILDRPEDQGRAASILVFFLVLGLTVGALLSTPLLRLL